ncbi:MAG: hypothetical protein ACI3XR_08390 [Eubacteriales bacterium]
MDKKQSDQFRFIEQKSPADLEKSAGASLGFLRIIFAHHKDTSLWEEAFVGGFVFGDYFRPYAIFSILLTVCFVFALTIPTAWIRIRRRSESV